MFGIEFTNLPLAVNGLLFAVGAVAVWIAGTNLAIYADELAERTGIGRAFLGLVLLAGITSLPELVTSFSAVMVGDAPLAVNNLCGGIVMQTAILAIADARIGRGPLSYFTPKPELLLQGLLLIGLLGIVLVGVVAGDSTLPGGVGWCTTLVFGLYIFGVWTVARFEAGKHWRPVDLPDAMSQPAGDPPVTANANASWSLPRLCRAIALISIVITIAGTVLVATGEALSQQTNLGSSFIGATLLAGTTSLPELSTTLGAVKLRAYSMAFANIFGSNAIMVALLFIIDIVYQSGPILAEVDRSATFAAVMGIVVTAVYLIGLIMRRNRVILRMGIDSFVVMIAYLLTIAGLYALRAG